MGGCRCWLRPSDSSGDSGAFVLLALWLVIFIAMARNAPNRGSAKSFSEIMQPL